MPLLQMLDVRIFIYMSSTLFDFTLIIIINVNAFKFFFRPYRDFFENNKTEQCHNN